MVLEIHCVKPINPQYSGVLETCLALRYWFFEVLGSESVELKIMLTFQTTDRVYCQYEDYSTTKISMLKIAYCLVHRIIYIVEKCAKYETVQKWPRLHSLYIFRIF